jgi:hypothetical protein
VQAVPRLCGFYPGICLTTEERARKNLSQGSRRVPAGVMEIHKHTIRIHRHNNMNLICVCPCIVVICGEEKPTRCHSMIYCSCDLLYTFRTLICPSSGAPRLYLDYNARCEVPKLLVVGRQVLGSSLCVQRETSSCFFFST